MAFLGTAWGAVKDFAGKNKWLTCLGLATALAVSVGTTIVTIVSYLTPVVKYVEVTKMEHREALDLHKKRHENYTPEGHLASVDEETDLHREASSVSSTAKEENEIPAAVLMPPKAPWLSLGLVAGSDLAWNPSGGAQVWIGPLTGSAVVDKELTPRFYVAGKLLNF